MNTDPQYCIRIEGLPVKITVENLSKLLKVGGEHLEKKYRFDIPRRPLNKPTYAYLHNIGSERYARNFVKIWHNNTSFQDNYKLKCQIEYEEGHTCKTTTIARNSNEELLPAEKGNNMLVNTQTETGDSPGETKK